MHLHCRPKSRKTIRLTVANVINVYFIYVDIYLNEIYVYHNGVSQMNFCLHEPHLRKTRNWSAVIGVWIAHPQT